VIGSGLLNETFSETVFRNSYNVTGNSIQLLNAEYVDQVAQLIARFLREEMLRLKRRFSFETVFSHHSNLDIMERAKNAGYKVYLYFVSTESPEINIYRVKLRVLKDGHNVPENKIRKRYYKSLRLMYPAADLCHQAFFFDNSKMYAAFTLVGHFKRTGNSKNWDKIPAKNISKWFRKYNTPDPPVITEQ
jgi:predicted ABC-type ATPase